MKKYLPQSSGFTLIELLVVIAIIAVLAVMGFAAYTGLTSRGNDARRSADMKAFADAMEVSRGTNASYNTGGSASNTIISANSFSTGKFPFEPTSRAAKYCYKDSTSASVSNTLITDWASLTAGCPSGWTSVDGVAPTVAAGALYFKVCTLNEAANTPICQGSRQ